MYANVKSTLEAKKIYARPKDYEDIHNLVKFLINIF